MVDRQSSLLTNSQRDYLREGKEGAAGRMARKRIRERVHEGLHDFPLLVSAYHDEKLAGAFEDRDLENKEHTLNVLSSAFAFLYLGISDAVQTGRFGEKEAFEGIVERGLQEAYRAQGEPVADVSVSIEVEAIDSTKPVEDMTLGEIQEHAKEGNMDRQILLQRLTETFEEHNDPEESLSAEKYDIDKSRSEWFTDMLTPDSDDDE